MKNDDDTINLTGDELHHAVKVMRNKEGNEVFITDGNGIIYTCNINKILKDRLSAEIVDRKKYKNKLSNITFCFPVLKNPDRFKFALEKCTELGITNFIIFNSNRSVAKVKNIEKWNKTLLAAMKQSLRAFLPKLQSTENLKELLNLDGKKIIFDQSGKNIFSKEIIKFDVDYYFIFGPEGGFTEEELSYFSKVYSLAENRLRSETAIVKCASLIG